MFFVGATGQLLTLLLTVSLPLIMLVSGQPKNRIKQSQQKYQVQQIEESKSNSDFHFNNVFEDFYTEDQTCPLYYAEQIILKILPVNEKVKWKTFYLNESGNKAPPLYV